MQTGNKHLYILTIKNKNMKKVFTLTIFSLIILLSCGKSKEEKALDDLRNIGDKFMEEAGADWEESIDYMEDYENVMDEAMKDYDEYMDEYGEVMDEYMDEYGEIMDEYMENYDEYMEDYSEIMNETMENYDEYMEDAMDIYQDAYEDAMDMLDDYDYSDYY